MSRCPAVLRSRKAQHVSNESLVNDLESLSILSGIGMTPLRRMLAGELAPSREHVKRLSEHLSTEDVALFRNHSLREVDVVRERRGSVPEGAKLLIGLQPKDLKPGDMLVLSGKSFKGATMWMRLDNVTLQGVMARLHVSDRVIPISTEARLRVARPVDS